MEGDMRSIPFESGSFDGIVSMNTLHYVRNTLVSVFKEMKRTLKARGDLVLFAVGLEQCLQFWLGHYFPFFWEVGIKALTPTAVIIDSLKHYRANF
jgi:SAM-dependent methyltransferase